MRLVRSPSFSFRKNQYLGSVNFNTKNTRPWLALNLSLHNGSGYSAFTAVNKLFSYSRHWNLNSLVLHCAFLLRTIFASLERAHQRVHVHVHNVRDFPQNKLDSEIKAPYLLNEHSDPHFLFHKFINNNILNKWEKNWQKSMATFLANKKNATERDITGPTELVQIVWLWVQIMFPLRDKIMKGIWNNFFFLERRWINNQRKSNSEWYNTPHWKIIALICCARRSPKVTLITTFVSTVAWKQERWPPLFIPFLISPCPVTTEYQVSSEIYGGFIY